MATTIGTTTDANGVLTASATGNSALNTVDFNTFLKLLVAQLKNQDPLNPLDGTQFTGQIAQFSALEQQINTNNKLENLLEQRDYGQQTLANSYLGKVVLAPGDTIAMNGTTEFGYTLAKGATKVEIGIYNSEGKLVREVAGDKAEGNHIVTWDGKDADGKALAAGNYTVKISATDTDGKVVATSLLTYGKVASVLNDSGTASLILSDGRQAELDKILAVTSLNAS